MSFPRPIPKFPQTLVAHKCDTLYMLISLQSISCYLPDMPHIVEDRWVCECRAAQECLGVPGCQGLVAQLDQHLAGRGEDIGGPTLMETD